MCVCCFLRQAALLEKSQMTTWWVKNAWCILYCPDAILNVFCVSEWRRGDDSMLVSEECQKDHFITTCIVGRLKKQYTLVSRVAFLDELLSTRHQHMRAINLLKALTAAFSWIIVVPVVQNRIIAREEPKLFYGGVRPAQKDKKSQCLFDSWDVPSRNNKTLLNTDFLCRECAPLAAAFF